MEAIKTTIQQAIGQIGTIRIIDIIDIVIVTVLLYFIIDLIRRTQTSKVFTGILMILAALWLSGEIQLHTVNYILRNAVQIGLHVGDIIIEEFPVGFPHDQDFDPRISHRQHFGFFLE